MLVQMMTQTINVKIVQPIVMTGVGFIEIQWMKKKRNVKIVKSPAITGEGFIIELFANRLSLVLFLSLFCITRNLDL